MIVTKLLFGVDVRGNTQRELLENRLLRFGVIRAGNPLALLRAEVLRIALFLGKSRAFHRELVFLLQMVRALLRKVEARGQSSQKNRGFLNTFWEIAENVHENPVRTYADFLGKMELRPV